MPGCVTFSPSRPGDCSVRYRTKGLEDMMSTEIQGRPQPVGRRHQLESLALASIQRWNRFVRPLPLSAQSEEQQRQFRGLVAWYERVCADDQYSNSPPVDGIEALFAMPLECTLHDRFLSVVREAIRVAEELVRCRQLARDARLADSRSSEIARARLELSISAARERLDQLS